jgi:DNA/RNA-binding protein KIN17
MQAKGLQKLRFFCGMCKKQCRDGNGFKCHLESEAHLRQMEMFMANPDG